MAQGETFTVTVNDTTYSQDDDNLALNSEGIWELTIPEGSELQDGDYQVTATVTDEAGNIGTSTSTLSVDTVAPATPSITTQTSNIDTPIVSGIAPVAPDEILTVEINGITYTDGDSNLQLNTNGNWTLTIPEFNALTDDSYDVIASISDPAGNTTIAISRNALTVDTTPPVAPGITSMTTSDNTPVISGTAFLATGETLTVEVNGVTYIQGDGNLIVDTDDTWALTIPDADALIDGTYQVVAIITDAAGNTSSDPGTSEIQVDTDAPNIPGITSLQSNDTTPAIKGMATLASGESLSVEINGVTYAQGDGNLTIDPDGAWTLLVPTALAEGAYDIKATITDPAGNTGTSTSTGGLLIDVTAPAAPSVRPLTTADSTPSLTGVADLASGDTLSVEVNGVTYTEENSDLIVNTDGTWSVTIPANDALPDGNYSVTTTVTDASGNLAVADNALGIDTIAPTTPSISSLISSTDTPVISGIATVAQDETLTVTVNGVTYIQGDGTLVLDDNGNWELTIPVDDALGDGSYDATATVTDAAGNTTSDIVTNGLSVDTVAPATPSSTAQISNTDTPVISGVAIVVSGETLTVTVNGVTYTQGDGDLVLNDNGSWELTIPDDNNLNDGNYNVVAIITDQAGNFATETNTLSVDTVAPATPTSIVQISNTDTPIISGTATDVSDGTLVVTINGVTYTEADANLVLNSNGSWNLTIPQNDALPDGIYNVTAAVTDAAGNTTIAVSENALTVDTKPPVVPGITSMTTSDNTPFIEGTAFLTAGETLTVEINGVTYTQTDGNIIVNSDGNWTLTIPASDALADGRYQIVATATDGAGNSNTDSSINELLIDTIAPSAPTVEPLATTDTTPTLTGIAVLTPGDLLSVEVGGITYFQGDGNLIVNPNSTWALTIPATNALTEGNYPVTVTITDTASNSSGAVSPTELIIQPADDFDNDGIFDVVDLDDDNDGIPDTIEGTRDTDGDGHPDSRDLDSDNDGVYDIIEAGGDDTDNDGKVDNFRESDANGLSDDLQIAPFDLVDTDRDRIPDSRDLDSDNDGIPDVIESGGVDDNNNGRVDNFTDANGDGADDVSQMRSTAERDSDGDGVPNRLDLDSNNDGLSDSFEAGSADSRGDGIIDTMLDSDSDGIPDSVDVSQTAGEDTDNDGIDDRFDASFLLEDDLDGDGIVDSADPDADGDGLADDPQNALALGQALPDNNGNGEFDGFDVDEGALRVGLSGRGGCSISPTPNNGSVDPLFALMLSVVATLLWRKRLIRIRGVESVCNSGASSRSLQMCSKIKSKQAVVGNLLPIAILLTTAFAASLTTTDAHADSRGLQPWLGVGAGISRLQPDASAVNQRVIDDRDIALSAMLGLDLNHRFSVQLGYTDLGRAELTNNNHIAYYELSVDTLIYGLANRFRREHRLGFLPFGRVGISQMKNSSSLPFVRENDVSINFGLGLEYATHLGLAARVEVTSFDTDALFAGVGLLYRFGTHNEHPAQATAAVTPLPATSLPKELAAVEKTPEFPKILTLGPVLFDPDSDLLNTASGMQVARIATILRKNSGHVVVIEGYADLIGPVPYNLALSQRRAIAVKDELDRLGIEVSGFTIRPIGETDRFGSMSTTEGRQQNRRVNVVATPRSRSK